ncbi:hypothetical protein AAFF_G00208870 [Aldrovandia affinis]|uniref:PAS fold-3 domain-containing protein n=1 Tax=Aldrovandia affinis TaxID=143900 RepID=A0AAD7RJT5_9TELE|nr:hypothetical protein AAFF_G00208870 [Aldrovandia affinis]
MACDSKGKIVLGYTEAELRVRGSGYQFIHAADMLYCAENHVRMIKTGESGLTVFRLLTKDNRWKWVQANARLVYKNGKPDYIIATQRPLVEEEGGEHLRKRSLHLPFTFATGEALLYQVSYPIPGFGDSLQGRGKSSKAKKGSKSSSDEPDPGSLLGALMRQDESRPVRGGRRGGRVPRALGGGGARGPEGPAGPGSDGSSFDPLLATLDSLSLEGEESCSNSELFGALEGLGLSAEDLELLLLDERMIRVELEPDWTPSLSDLLTNSEILAYIHDSLEGRADEVTRPLTSDPRSQDTPTLAPPPAPPWPAPRPQPAPHPAAVPADAAARDWPARGEGVQGPPQLSAPPLTGQHSDSGPPPAESSPQSWERPPRNGRLATQHSHTGPGPQDGRAHLRQQEALFNGEPSRQQSQSQWQPNPPLLQLHPQCHFRPKEGGASGLPLNGLFPPLDPQGGHQWHGYGYGHQGALQAAAQPAGEVPGFTGNRGLGDAGAYQGAATTSSSYQAAHRRQPRPGQAPPSATPSCFSPYPTPDSALEQILGPSNQLPPLESYGLFTPTPPTHPSHSETENGCMLNGTGPAHSGTRPTPKGSGVMPGDAPAPP